MANTIGHLLSTSSGIKFYTFWKISWVLERFLINFPGWLSRDPWLGNLWANNNKNCLIKKTGKFFFVLINLSLLRSSSFFQISWKKMHRSMIFNLCLYLQQRLSLIWAPQLIWKIFKTKRSDFINFINNSTKSWLIFLFAIYFLQYVCLQYESMYFPESYLLVVTFGRNDLMTYSLTYKSIIITTKKKS